MMFADTLSFHPDVRAFLPIHLITSTRNAWISSGPETSRGI
jgi:hypothetical protein